MLHSRMHARRIQLQILDAVALIAELVPLLLENEFSHDPMPKVTSLTLAVIDHRMNIAHRKVFFKKVLVTIEALLSLELALLGVGRRCKAQREHDAAKNSHPNQGCISS